MLDGTDAVAHEYAQLVAQSARLLPGLADVPAALRRHAFAGPPPRAGALVKDVGRLRVALADAGQPTPRTRFLDAQLRALECTVRRLAGQEVAFPAEISETFGVTVEPGAADVYADAHRALGALLPGSGSLARRCAEYRRHDEVPPALLLLAVRALSAALRERAAAVLPPGECVEYRLVADAPWAALHTWLGHGRSIVTVNLGARPRWGGLPALVAHEAYPGHHTQRCRAELGGTPERDVVLVRSPHAVVAEGAAEVGLGVLVGPGWGIWAEEVLADAGLGRSFDGGLAERLDAVARDLRPVRQDAALLLHDRRLPYGARPEAARRHIERWLLVEPSRARRIVDGLGGPLWRGYVAAHVEGPRLVNSWLRRGTEGSPARFRRVLDEQLLPVDLRPADTGALDAGGGDRRPAAALA